LKLLFFLTGLKKFGKKLNAGFFKNMFNSFSSSSKFFISLILFFRKGGTIESISTANTTRLCFSLNYLRVISVISFLGSEEKDENDRKNRLKEKRILIISKKPCEKILFVLY
jgi:hypothetical protein